MLSKKDLSSFISKLLNKNNKFALPAMVAALGIILILASNIIFSGSTKQTPKKETNEVMGSANEYKKDLEKTIKEGLSTVKGVGKVNVVITLSGETSKEIAYNETTTKSTGAATEQSTVTKDAILIKDGNTSSPYTVEGSYPEVTGIMVVAQGANDPTIEYYITQSVKTLLNLPSHKIIVLPMDDE